MNVFDQIVGELPRSRVERAPSRAGLVGRREVVGQRLDGAKVRAMIVVFRQHTADWTTNRRMPALPHQGEQELFLLLHMDFEFCNDLREPISQPDRR